MKVADFMDKLGAKGVRLGVCSGKIQYDAPRGVMLPDDIATLKKHMAEILAHLQKEGAPTLLPVNEIILGRTFRTPGMPSLPIFLWPMGQ